MSHVSNIRQAVRYTLAAAAFASAYAGSATAQTELEEVVVSGSRIARADYDAASPVITLDQDLFNMSGEAQLETVLNSMPQLVPSITTTSNNPSNGGQANVDLRGLGTVRTLRKALKAGFRQFAFDIETRQADEGRARLADLVKVEEIRNDGIVLEDERVTVRAARVEHPPIRDAYAYRFDTSSVSVVISGDTAPSDNLIRLARGADILVHEVLLLSPEKTAEWLQLRLDHPLTQHVVRSQTSYAEVGKIAAAAGVRKLVLTHFVPAEGALDTEAVLGEIRKSFGGEVIFGEDLLEVR